MRSTGVGFSIEDKYKIGAISKIERDLALDALNEVDFDIEINTNSGIYTVMDYNSHYLYSDMLKERNYTIALLKHKVEYSLLKPAHYLFESMSESKIKEIQLEKINNFKQSIIVLKRALIDAMPDLNEIATKKQLNKIQFKKQGMSYMIIPKYTAFTGDY